MELKVFLAFHAFELTYLAILAVLPFIVSIRIIAILVILVMSILAVQALIRKYTYKAIEVNGQTVLVTGCDTGFGHALVKRLDSLGFTVIAGCLDDQSEGAGVLRNWGDSGRIHVLKLDVTSDEAVGSAVQYAEKLSDKGLWALVNNAAVNFVGEAEFCTLEMFKNVAEVNQFGIIRMTKAFLPLIRKSKGRVINVTSAKGRLPLPASAVYGATKYASETFSDILRLEMFKFGVKVIIVEPGDFGGSTGMLSPKTLSWLRAQMDVMWEAASDEVREAYGKEYFDSLYSGTVNAAKEAARSIGPVVDAMADAVINVRPEIRYLVDGSRKLVDYNNFLIRIGSYIPYSWQDYLLDREYNRGLPPVKAAAR